ncbi:MAG: hypothetical protein GY810_06325 [Aureispira sp.]|nr:hypothetical protein [Aureispira sp.]
MYKQILIWIVYSLFWITIIHDEFESWRMVIELIVFVLIGHGCLFYINYYGLMPKLFVKKRYFLYTIISLGVLILWYLVSRSFSTWMFQNGYWEVVGQWPKLANHRIPNQIGRIVGIWFHGTGTIIYLSSLIAFNTQQVRRKESKILVLENEKLNAEMRMMRMQINPHFLFNALNNIYSTAVLKPEQVAESIHKLSGLLRYALYDCDTDRIALKREVEYLQNYIDLQRLKDDELGEIEFDIKGNIGGVYILPMILVAFVENSFKHGNIEQNGWIKIELVKEDNTLVFKCKNSIAAIAKQKDNTKGIGLSNVRKRLELMYPDSHELTISPEEDIFSVILKIDLNEN